MFRRSSLHLAPVFALALFLLFSVSSACIGEVAGKINFNVSAGGNQTQQMQVFNNCDNQSIYYSTRSQVNPVANELSPGIVVTPSSGVMLPRENIFLNITVSVPYNDTPGTAWRAGVAVQQANNATAAGGGATLSVGVVKLFNITALPPLPLPLIDYAIAGVAIAAGAAAAGGLYYFKAIRKPKRHIAKAVRRAPVRRAAKKTAKKKSGRRTSPKRTSRRRRR